MELLNSQFEAVFYKNNFAFGATVFNLYMTYGGTNWGNLGHPGGYTSYDYGAVIAEDRSITRQKYSEAKLLANFVRASPAYLTALPQSNAKAAGAFTGDSSIFTSQSLGQGTPTNFYFVRHTKYNTQDTATYKITLSTSEGDYTIPTLGGELTLLGRDTNIHVTDYDVGGDNMLYSTAEVFTWKKYSSKKVLVVYGPPDTTQELAFVTKETVKCIEGSGAKIDTKGKVVIINYQASPSRQVLQVGKDFFIYLLDKNTAYNYWTVDLPSGDIATGDPNKGVDGAAIINGPYLMRNASVDGGCVELVGDINATTTVEVIGGAPDHLTTLKFNGESLNFKTDSAGAASATVELKNPGVVAPDLSKAKWKTIDTLPEIKPGYDDSLWTDCSLDYTNNTARPLTAPVSTYGQDYGYSYGILEYRGRFTALGNDTTLSITTQGGDAYGHSIWLGSEFQSSFTGSPSNSYGTSSANLAGLKAGQEYIVTVVVDNMGLDENYDIGSNEAKNPRGIVNWNLDGRPQSDVTWKMTGNLGGEDVRDPSRGPLNEGGLWVERQGYYLPGAPTSSWTDSTGPDAGITHAGVQYYTTTFDLDVPQGYDIPLAVSFGGDAPGSSQKPYRCEIFVNGYQYGKYVNNIGPQTVFPVPQGIWNYNGENTLGVTLWALDNSGAKTVDFGLQFGAVVQSGYGAVANSPMVPWQKREGAY